MNHRKNDRKPRKYAKAKVEFVSSNNTNKSIISLILIYLMSCVESGNANREL